MFRNIDLNLLVSSVLVLLTVARAGLTDDDSDDNDDDDHRIFLKLEELDKEVCKAFSLSEHVERELALKGINMYAYFLQLVSSDLTSEQRGSRCFQKSKQIIDNGGPNFFKENYDIDQFLVLYNYTFSEKQCLIDQVRKIEMLLQNIEKFVYPERTYRPDEHTNHSYESQWYCSSFQVLH